MGPQRRVRGRAVLPSIAAFVAGAAGIAFADVVVPDGGGQLNACYSAATGGGVRFVDKQPGDCAPGESGVSWSQTGPPGPAGVAGATGPAGPAGVPGERGPAGASADAGGLQSFVATGRGRSDSGDRMVTEAQLTGLPAGRYLVLATVLTRTSMSSRIRADDPTDAECSIGTPESSAGGSYRHTLTVGTQDQTDPMIGIARVPAFGRLRVLCSGIVARRGARQMPSVRLVAVRLGA